MTAADRLKLLSGLAGVSAAAMLLAIGSGVTTGEALVNYSQLETGTAAEHLLADPAVVNPPVEVTQGAGSSKRISHNPEAKAYEALLQAEDEIILSAIVAAVTQGMLT